MVGVLNIYLHLSFNVRPLYKCNLLYGQGQMFLLNYIVWHVKFSLTAAILPAKYFWDFLWETFNPVFAITMLKFPSAIKQNKTKQNKAFKSQIGLI